MLKIRLARVGKKNQPQFRIVVTEHTRPAKSNFLEVLGFYLPKEKSKIQSLKLERIKYWLKRGAHLSDRVLILLKPYLTDDAVIAYQTKILEKKISHRKEILAKRKQELKKEETKKPEVKKQESVKEDEPKKSETSEK